MTPEERADRAINNAAADAICRGDERPRREAYRGFIAAEIRDALEPAEAEVERLRGILWGNFAPTAKYCGVERPKRDTSR